MTCCVIAPLSRKMQNKGLEAIGDATTTEEIHLQDRILRILSNSTEPSDVVFLYFNNQFPEDPPSRSLFEEDALTDFIELSEKNKNSCSNRRQSNVCVWWWLDDGSPFFPADTQNSDKTFIPGS
ncbi:hypothetical protein HUJ05_005503 [Dendroctonus ponderosae]|nr:hypothetical protein HUJ05_005503 [Dendroctonus ponderosae]